MIISVGEILVDIFPEYRRIGGAPFNFACHLKHFGLPVRFFSRVGEDKDGNDILDFIKKYDFSEKDIQKDHKHNTGSVHVTEAPDKGPSFDIVKNAAYDHIEPDNRVTEVLRIPPKMLYWGTLIQRTPNGLSFIHHLLKKKAPETRGFFDINLRPGCYSEASILKSLEYADILKLNTDELAELSTMLNMKEAPDPFIDHIKKKWNIEWVALTKGGEGSTLYTNNGKFSALPEKHIKFESSVGAGDAYASVIALGYINNWPPEKTLKHASNFASAICTQKGAVPESSDFYASFLTLFEKSPYEK